MPCNFRRCVAVSERDFCPVHQPDVILRRAKTIVSRHLARLEKTLTKESLREVRAAILHDLEDTV